MKNTYCNLIIYMLEYEKKKGNHREELINGNS
jgi:hypothetical protein